MDAVNVLTVICIVGTLLFLIFQLKWWSNIFGIEYFEEKYSFKKPMTTDSIRNMFVSLELLTYEKKLNFSINMKSFYSVGHEGEDDWSSWIPVENMPNKDFDGFDIRIKNAWTILAYGYPLSLTVFHDDSTLFYEKESYEEIRLVGQGIVKLPWNRKNIIRERQFLKDVVSALENFEQKSLN